MRTMNARHLLPPAVLLAAASWLGAQEGPAPRDGQIGPPAAPPGLEAHRLPEGGRLVLLPAEGTECVEGLLVFQAGERTAAPRPAGTPRALGPTLRACGSTSSSAAELEAWLEEHDAELAIESGLTTLRFAFSCRPEDLGDQLARLRDLVASPAYSREGARLVAPARRAGPADAADRLLDELGYGRDSIVARHRWGGAGVTLAGVAAHHRLHLGGERLWIGLSCPPSMGDPVATVRGALVELPATPSLPRIRPVEGFRKPAGPRIYLLDAPTAERSELRVGGPSSSGEGSDSTLVRLWLAGVRELGMAAVSRPDWSGHGDWRIAASVPHQELAPRIRALRARFADADGMWERLRASLSDRSPRPDHRAASPLELACAGLRPDHQERELERLRAASRTELETALRPLLDPDRWLIVVVGPAGLLRGPLEEIAPVTPLNPTGAAGLDLAALDQLQRMFEALGGHRRWAALQSCERSGMIRLEASTRSIRSRVLQRFEPLAAIMEQDFGGQASSRLINETGAWEWREGIVRLSSSREHRDQLAAIRRTLYYVLHRLAGDPEVRVRLGAGGRLEVVADNGFDYLVWLELDEEGRPRRMGSRLPSEQGDLEVTYEAWARIDGYVYASRTRMPAHGILREMTFRPDPPLAEDAFEPPR